MKANWTVLTEEAHHTFTHFHLRLGLRIADLPENSAPERGFFLAAGEFRPTDLPTVMTHYPSDNAGLIDVPDDTVQIEQASDRDPETSSQPGVLLVSYCWGDDARQLGYMHEPHRSRQ